jgi:hypothetical protein
MVKSQPGGLSAVGAQARFAEEGQIGPGLDRKPNWKPDIFSKLSEI